MTKVITYGTYDLLHYGHIRLLERAKSLGDYLIVGVTADSFDRGRGKINVTQSLGERIEAIRNTGLADEIIIEEYEGQKIDDIRRLGVDIFTVGSDWKGHFDYLNEYCKVVYLERTEGVSSTEIRQKKNRLPIGLVGDTKFINKVISELKYVNGIEIVGLFTASPDMVLDEVKAMVNVVDSFEELVEKSEAVYIDSFPQKHYAQTKYALEKGRHVLCESPMALSSTEYAELRKIADNNDLILIDALRTAYSTAFSRMLLMLKGGIIGKIVSVDATCTSLREFQVINKDENNGYWNSISAWGPTALLPVFELLGTEYNKLDMVSHLRDGIELYDDFTKISFVYDNAVASVKVGTGVKSEGELIISGTKGYVYVPAPWWKTDYFEVRYENIEDNNRFFYKLDGEGIRYEFVSFTKAVEKKNIQYGTYIESKVSEKICDIMDEFFNKNDFVRI